MVTDFLGCVMSGAKALRLGRRGRQAKRRGLCLCLGAEKIDIDCFRSSLNSCSNKQDKTKISNLAVYSGYIRFILKAPLSPIKNWRTNPDEMFQNLQNCVTLLVRYVRYNLSDKYQLLFSAVLYKPKIHLRYCLFREKWSMKRRWW